MGGAASVRIKEVDLSTRVASFAGVFGAIVVPARKGQSDPFLCTSDTQFLNAFTANGQVEVGDDLSHFSALSFLERANKLWIKRVSNGALFGGVVIEEDGSANVNTALTLGVADPTARVFGATESLFFYGASEGVFNNDISIKVTTVIDNPDLIEPNSFLVEIFKSTNLAVPVEDYLCSRVLGQKDGRGLNMYVEDVLQASNYIRCISNDLISGTILPKSQPVALAFAGGDDGLAVTDANMVNAVQAYANTNKIPLTILMDGGYSVPAYQIACDTIAQQRGDCVAILTTPYAKEITANYLNDIVDYRKNLLNLNSSRSGLYTPHLQIQDRFNDRKIWIAPDGHVGGSISFSAANYEIWYPPAGFRRGILNVLDTRQRFSDGELDVLYNAGINPVRFFPGKGIVVWGQKTLQARASALDRMNVRLLLIVIEPAIKAFLENFLFELNDASVRAIIETKLESYLETIKAKKGITAYDVVSNDSNNLPADIDANRLIVDIFIKPSRSVEDIPVRIVITPNNISFSQASNSI